MNPEQLATAVAGLQPIIAGHLRDGRDIDLSAALDEAAVVIGHTAEESDRTLVEQILDHACRPDDPAPGEFVELYRRALSGAEIDAALRRLVLLLGNSLLDPLDHRALLGLSRGRGGRGART